MKEKFSLKDALFNKKRVVYLADLFVAAHGDFEKHKFVSEVVEKFPELELKARIVWIAQVLKRYLPDDMRKALVLIVQALPPELDVTQTDDDFGEFILAPLAEYVVQNACTREYVEQALNTLYEITKRFSVEFAIRSFINSFPDETLTRLDTWVGDSNYHVRRLVSEGSRPLLPWAQRLSLNYHVPLKYLDVLHVDSTRYVTRSVANHLNDISKKDPRLVVATLQRWQQAGKQDSKELTWMTKHALRTLIKKGNLDALALLGFGADSNVAVTDFVVGTPVINRGEKLEFSCTVTSSAVSRVLIDYVIDFVKANGQTKPKVFKLKQITLEPGESITISKAHLLKADATTFTVHAGVHTVTLQINGVMSATTQFTVT